MTRTTPLCTAIAMTITCMMTTAVVARSLAEMMEEWDGTDPQAALVEAREILAKLRQDNPDPESGALGNAAAVTGALASKTGNHKEAIVLLKEGLPMIAAMRRKELMLDEYQFASCLVESLRALDRSAEAIPHLESLLKRTRKGVRIREHLVVANPGRPGALDARALLPTHQWLIDLLQQLGDIHMEHADWAPAEAAFREAEALLAEHFPDEQQIRLARLQESGDIAARKQGKTVRPRMVGRFGHPRAIRIEGARQIDEKEIRSALMRSTGFVLSTHPSADFEAFRKKAESALISGYRVAGFPEAEVTVDWDEQSNEVVACIREGTRYRIGQLMIEGATVIDEKDLLERLSRPEGQKAPGIPRATSTFRHLDNVKRLPAPAVKKVADEVFPWLTHLQEDPARTASNEKLAHGPVSNLFKTFETIAGEEECPWQPGKWMNQNSDLALVSAHLRELYAEEGRLFVDFEIDWVLRTDDRVADARIRILSEGRPMKLGTIHVKGNRVNSREDLLEHVALREGMPIEAGLTLDVKRRLFDSGRFRGWEVVTAAVPGKPDELDLLIIVAEQWDAPPLSAPLSREQDAWLRFADWCNSRAIEQTDIVIALDTPGLERFRGCEVVISAAGFGMVADMPDGNRVQFITTEAGAIEFLLQTTEKSWSVKSPTTDRAPSRFFVLNDTVSPDYVPGPPQDQLHRHTVRLGMAISTLTDGGLVFAIDPTLALGQAGSSKKTRVTFQAGTVVVSMPMGTLQFDELTGRLIEYRLESDGPGTLSLTATSENNALDRIRKDARRGEELVEMEMHNPIAAGVSLFGTLAEMAAEFREEDVLPGNTRILECIGTGMQRWTPLAHVLAGILGTERDEDHFYIPMGVDEYAMAQRSMALWTFVGLGIYDMLYPLVEPGTWPDRVMREAIFLLGGQPHSLNMTAGELLADESMGPIGSLACAALLQQVSHGKAREFLQKARRELGEEGFAKDWGLFIKGKAYEDRVGWKLLWALRDMRPGVLDAILPDEDGPLAGFRDPVDQFLSKTRALDNTVRADAFAPVMNSLWKEMEPHLEESIAQGIEDLTPRVDARKVALTVHDSNGFIHIPRGAVRLTERIAPIMGIEKIQTDWEDQCLADLLFAREVWNTGGAMEAAKVNELTDQIVAQLGNDGWDQVAAMGLTKPECRKWVETVATGRFFAGELVKRSGITDEEVRAFYEERPDLFGAAPRQGVHMITLQPDENGVDQGPVARNIHAKVSAQPDLDAKIAEFRKHGAENWRESNTQDIAPWMLPIINGMVGRKQVLSDVIHKRSGGKDYFFLVLIPGEAKAGTAKPFEEVKARARVLAILDREGQRLRQAAQVDRFAMPAPDAPAPDLPDKDGDAPGQPSLPGSGQIAKMMDTAAKIMIPEGEKAGEAKARGRIHLYEETKRKAATGSAEHLYLMGTYAERGIGDPAGLEAAVGFYGKAAEAGSPHAMRRLAELHRIGRGVARDDAKAGAWLRKASEALEEPAG